MRVDLEQRADDVAQLRPHLTSLAQETATPLYVFDRLEAARNLDHFKRAFAAAGVEVQPFYAVKSNPYLGLLRSVVEAGGGLDVSSQRELRLALRARAQRIVYTGPGKRSDDLELVLRHRRRVVPHLESLREMQKLGELAAGRCQEIRCGLRLVTRHQSKWKKFGIPLDELHECWEIMRRFPQLRISGLHFHSGTLTGPEPVVATIEEVGRFLRQALTAPERRALTFFDVGGGVIPAAFEGVYPWNRAQSMSFDVDPRLTQQILNDEIKPHYEPAEVVPVEYYAREVVGAFRREILASCPAAALYAEPGKFISHSVLHLLFSVVDLKGSQAMIVDGGTNMIGWEKFEFFDYAPIFNLTRFAPGEERPFLVYGSLCTPHDLWGYYLRGGAPQVGDLLCIPFQGAYTYTLAQSFIQPIPPVVDLPRR